MTDCFAIVLSYFKLQLSIVICIKFCSFLSQGKRVHSDEQTSGAALPPASCFAFREQRGRRRGGKKSELVQSKIMLDKVLFFSLGLSTVLCD